MAVGLVGAAHNPKGQGDPPSFGQHTGDDGVHRALAAGQLIRVARLKREARPAI